MMRRLIIALALLLAHMPVCGMAASWKDAPANTEMGVAYGGTGAGTAAGARANLGISKSVYTNLTTGSQTLSLSDAGNVHTNKDASANVTFVLPACGSSLVGVSWKFETYSSTYRIFVTPNSADKFANVASSADGGRMQSPLIADRPWSSAVVQCIQVSGGGYDLLIKDDGLWTYAD